MPAHVTAHTVRHALASVALILGLLIGSAASAGAQQTMDRADTLAALRAASATPRQHVDTGCVVRMGTSTKTSTSDVWQCTTSWTTTFNASPAICATAARWLGSPGHIGFMGLDYVSCESMTGRVPDHAADAQQRQLTMERDDNAGW